MTQRSRIVLALVVCTWLQSVSAYAQAYNPVAVDVTRALVKDLFQSNAVPYIQPMVTSINATSNARFFNQAYVPTKVDKPYFRVGIHGMMGIVRDDQKSFVPSLDLGAPSTNLLTDVARYGTIDVVNRRFVINGRYEDTLGLTNLLLRETLIEAQRQGRFPLPGRAATLFGNIPDVRVYLPTTDTLLAVLRRRSDYQAILSIAGPGLDSSLTSLIDSLSLPNYLTLPPGSNMSTLMAAVPQLEIGSWMGTELLLRFVPPVQFDENVGKFSFYGIGIKHSISQYLPDTTLHLAVQGVFQKTSLTNSVGVTSSELSADADMWSVNIHASKKLFGFLDIFTGLAYERIDVVSTYTYVLPQEVQISLGLLPDQPAPGVPSVPTPEQPGDTRPQTSIVNAGNSNVKWVVGATGQIGPVRIFADYNVSQFNILSGGLEVQF
jgi:hypothetical protein